MVQAFSQEFFHELFTQKNPPRIAAGLREGTGLLLPGALLVTIGLQALAALVLVHLQAAFLFQVAHDWRLGDSELVIRFGTAFGVLGEDIGTPSP